jgi:anti-sigma factor ChrR (cupin superfamily)
VKLWQFTAGDTAPLRLDTRAGEWRQGLVPGLTVLPLHSHDGIDTALVRWAPHTRFQPHTHPGGEEILVLQGFFLTNGAATRRAAGCAARAGANTRRSPRPRVR